jgi:hypothetical protein
MNVLADGSVAECLPSIWETCSSIPSTGGKKTETKKKYIKDMMSEKGSLKKKFKSPNCHCKNDS